MQPLLELVKAKVVSHQFNLWCHLISRVTGTRRLTWSIREPRNIGQSLSSRLRIYRSNTNAALAFDVVCFLSSRFSHARFDLLAYAASPASPLPKRIRLDGSGVGLGAEEATSHGDGPATTSRVTFVGFTTTAKCSLGLMWAPLIVAKLPVSLAKFIMSNVLPRVGTKPLIRWRFSVPPRVTVPVTFNWSNWVPAVDPPMSAAKTPVEDWT